MKRSICLLAVVVAGGAAAHDADRFSIQSLNAPDPVFTAADSVPIRVSTGSSAAARRASVRVNGDEVTSALAETEPGVLTGTVTGLQPGINSIEVFKNRH